MSNYPESFDSDENLYLVHDSLRVRLSEDYQPGDTFITIEPDSVFDKFPSTGIISLTEQCSDIEVRSISFKYTSKGADTFEGLELLDGFVDTAKPKRITNVTQNVMSVHHNELKDSFIAIEEFVGVKGETASVPLVGTMEQRINYLRNLVLQPKAWFTVSGRIGIYPLCIDLTDFSTREPDQWEWDFGDGNTEIILRTDDILTGNTTKCYTIPGIYSITLKVTNAYGENEVVLNDYITVREQAPDEAIIDFIPTSSQVYDDGVLRSRINQVISLSISDNGEQPLDSIVSYLWELGDDYSHDDTSETKASYGVGGLYDVKVRAETELGAYRITTYENVIDIIEKLNIWHFIFDPASVSTATTKTLYAYEFGLLSETYKTANVSSSLSVTRDADFLSGELSYDRQYYEFRRNNGFAAKSLTNSGDKGNSFAFWAEDQNTIRFKEFNGFNNLWTTPVLSNGSDNFTRDWNWLSLISNDTAYFLFGAPSGSFTGSPTDQNFKSLSLSSYQLNDFSVTYANGADELLENVGSSGDFSVYRGAWKDSTGYFLRNDGVGSFFRIKSFYKTEGIISDPIQTITKLTDMPGTAKLEGQLVSLSNGLYFFNNTGEFLFYDTSASTWSVGGPGIGSPSFTKFQDKTISGYDDDSNSLIAISDQSTRAYLFFDYSTRAQMKFNETDGTFTSLPIRPNGEQFVAGLY